MSRRSLRNSAVSVTVADAKPLAIPLAIPVEASTVLRGNIVDLGAPAQAGDIPKGRSVSGRAWKVRPQKRASSLKTTVMNNASKSWEARQAMKLARQQAKELQTELQTETRAAIMLKRERRLANEKRKAENEYQTLQRSAQTLNHARMGGTLKSLSKKQLRQIKKTRVNTTTGVIEYVSPYAK
jgi:rRNA-processing protein CGR1